MTKLELPRIILASQSPRRKALLESIGLDFEVIVKHADENIPPDTPVEKIPELIAHEKAMAVKKEVMRWAERQTEDSIHYPILAADTLVELDGKMIGKPGNRNEAISMLQMLSGKTHRVITGVVIYTPQKEISFTDITLVTFYPLLQNQIEFYVDHYKPFDKAGAYGIQEWIGLVGIKSIEGDFYNVMGLPVSRVLQALYSL
ncbi:MAG TPA: Maf family protein [Phnomibacter sp.]|nr:Maf family protein [Phnomibacter sp.]